MPPDSWISELFQAVIYQKALIYLEESTMLIGTFFLHSCQLNFKDSFNML